MKTGDKVKILAAKEGMAPDFTHKFEGSEGVILQQHTYSIEGFDWDVKVTGSSSKHVPFYEEELEVIN